MAFFDDRTVSGLDKFSTFQNRRELRRMRRKLWRHEQLLRVIEAHHHARRGVLGLTNERLIWVPNQLLGGIAIFTLRELKKMRGTDEEGGALSIESGQLDLLLTRITPGAATPFAAEANQLARDGGNAAFRSAASRAEAVQTEEDDDEIEARLARLGRMLERGSMTREEYLIACQQAHSRGRSEPRPDPASAWWRRW